MTDQKIYPLNPIHETTTSDGRRAWVAFYTPDNRYVWRGLVEGMIIGAATWTPSGGYGDGFPEGQDLTSVPEVPPEAREPKPGEIWETVIGEPHLILEEPINNGVATMSRTLSTGRVMVSRLPRPWPAYKPHGFEALIDAILKAHGESQ